MREIVGVKLIKIPAYHHTVSDTGRHWLNSNKYSLTVYIAIAIHHALVIDKASSSTGKTIVGNDAVRLIKNAAQRKRLWEKKVKERGWP